MQSSTGRRWIKKRLLDTVGYREGMIENSIESITVCKVDGPVEFDP